MITINAIAWFRRHNLRKGNVPLLDKEIDMRVRDIMTVRPVTADLDTPLRDVARRMADFRCGEIPITEGARLVGVVTDRDIACRAVALGKDPATTMASEVMTKTPATVAPDEALNVAISLMEDLQVRRLPVVDEDGAIVGIISMTDISLYAPRRKAGTLLREVSRRRRYVARPTV